VFKNCIQTQAREVLYATGISGHKVLRLMHPPQLHHATTAGDSTQSGNGIGISLGWKNIACPSNQRSSYCYPTNRYLWFCGPNIHYWLSVTDSSTFKFFDVILYIKESNLLFEICVIPSKQVINSLLALFSIVFMTITLWSGDLIV